MKDRTKFKYLDHGSFLPRQFSEICDQFMTTPEKVKGRSRKGEVVTARHTAIWLMKNTRADLSLVRIGAPFGHLDHSSVINAIQKAEDRRDTIKWYRAYTDELLKKEKEVDQWKRRELPEFNF